MDRIQAERIRAVQGHSNGVTINQIQTNFIFFDKDTFELEGTRVPHGQLFQLQFNLREWSMCRK